jgi:predicted HAD superfamily phosphohydrolase
MEIRREDLLVFKLLSESFSEYYFIGDHRLISEILHGHSLLADLVDIKNSAALLTNERRRMREQLRTSLSEEEINKKLDENFSKAIEVLWKDFSEKVKAIDERFDSLLPKLGNVPRTANNAFH